MKRYLALIAVIVLAAGAAWWQAQRPERALDADSAAVLRGWPQLAQDRIRQVEIRHAGVQVLLKRGDSGWLVRDRYGDVAANGDLVDRLLRDLVEMRPVRVVTRNPDYFDRFRLGKEADRLVLRDADGQALLDLLVGKPGSDLISTTVRRAGENSVMTVDRSLGWQVGRKPAQWRALKHRKETPSAG